jgi:hypothetical protein
VTGVAISVDGGFSGLTFGGEWGNGPGNDSGRVSGSSGIAHLVIDFEYPHQMFE